MPRLFTVRAMVFSCVLLLAFVLVYPTLHSYLQQRVEVDQLRGQVEAARQRNDDLEADLERWDDPAYVTAQARERLSFVMPGEKAFRVIDPETVPDTPPAADGPASVLDSGLDAALVRERVGVRAGRRRDAGGRVRTMPRRRATMGRPPRPHGPGGRLTRPRARTDRSL